MKVLDLFAGLGGWSGPFADRGHDITTLDLEPRFGCTHTRDILEVTSLLELGGPFDIVLASPPCESFSVLTIGRNWTGPNDEHPHQPKTDKARLAVRIVEQTRRLIEDHEPAFFVIENPVAKLRKLPVMFDLERRTVTYCRYGEPFRKPTDLWGGFPPSLHLEAPCRSFGYGTTPVDGMEWARDATGQPCHVSSPRGSTTGLQGDGRAKRRLPDGTRVPVGESSSMEWRRNRRGNLTMHKRQAREMHGTSDARQLAAERAKIPLALALALALAAERDLAAGLRWARTQGILEFVTAMPYDEGTKGEAREQDR